MPRTRSPAVGFVLVTLALEVLGFGLLIPVAPKLVIELTGGTEETAAPAVGLLMATYAVVQFMCAPILGALSDRYGRRPVILFSILGSGLDFFAQALAPTLSILFLTRAINGLTGAAVTASTAYIADVTPPERRAGAFGLIGAAFGLGFIIGPLLGGWLGSYDIRLPFYVAGVISLVNWLYGYFILPESLPPERRAPITFRNANPLGVFSGLARRPLVLGLAIAFFLNMLMEMMLRSTWVLYTGYRFGWGPREVGLSLGAVGVCAAIVQGGLARKVVPALGERASLLLGLALSVAAHVGYGLATAGWMIYAIILVHCLGGITQPAAQSLITRNVGVDEQGRSQGALTALQSLAAIIGPLLGTAVFAWFISAEAPFYLPGASFILGALIGTLGWCVALWAARRPDPAAS